MKFSISILALVCVFTLASCGGSKKDDEKAKQDSIKKADSLAQVAKYDSIKKAEELIAEELNKTHISTNENTYHKIGEHFAGGIVFHLDETCKHGYVVTDYYIAKNVNYPLALEKCNNYISGSYSDWRLPSIEELRYIFINLHKTNIYNLSGWYWSSSSCNSSKQIIKSFIGADWWLKHYKPRNALTESSIDCGEETCVEKYTECNVIGVRSF